MANNTISLRSLLEKEKLNGINFLDGEPAANAPRADKDKFKKHMDDMVDVGCLMLATMDSELQKQHENMVAYEMIQNLKEIYEGQARQERYETSKALFRCKMTEGTPVGAHVIKMMGYVQTLEKLGFPLKNELATDLILQSLPGSFKPFVLNFNMNEINKTLPQLLGMLRTAESDMKKDGSKSILLVREAKGNGKKVAKSKGYGKTKAKGKNVLKPKGAISKDGKCFHCNKSGHWKRNYPVYLEEVKKAKAVGASVSSIYVIDVNMSTSSSWVLDTGCGSHICTSVQGLHMRRNLAKGDVDLRVGNGERVAALAKSEALEKFKEFINEWNGVSERRNRTLLDMVRSMMSHSDLSISFWGHALEAATFTLNRVPSKSVQRTPHEMWTGKRPSMSFMKIWGCKAYVKHQMSMKLEPKSHKYHDEPKTYQEAVSCPDSEKWLEAKRSEMDSMSDNQTYKGRLVAKGYQQIHGIDYDEIFSPAALFKSIRNLLAIATFHDYEIWQMDVKIAFLNGKLEEDVYMTHPEGFVTPKNAGKVCKLQRSIYGLKQASRSWNLHFNDAIKEFGFIRNEDEPCVYKKFSGSTVSFLILYVDDILIIGNDIPTLQSVKAWLSSCFSIKDLGEATYILGVKI
ncbi:hypothetical protein V6N12_031331 [Hibiscus sabdariffa]|uniref:Reverse transcriptase Ty1/copia-type domain-containing protein n=1 Tax=Hibiscus sabdariffa TaxID=183260 RepID=A0ABR2E8M2_9ROSI